MASDGSSTSAIVQIVLMFLAVCVMGPALITFFVMKLATAGDPERPDRTKPRREPIDHMMLLAIKTELAVRRWWRYRRYTPRHAFRS